MGAGAFAYTDVATLALGRGAGTAEALLRRHRPVRRPGDGGRGHQDTQAGNRICLIIQRDPIQLAKEVATLDYLSGGRFLFGIGAGWNREEMADHGTDPKRVSN